MPDRERVIAGLEIQRDEMCGSSFCDKCPYFNGGEGANAHCGFEDLCNDAIKLIQGAQEIVRCGECRHGYRCEDDMKCENENQPAMCGQHFPEGWYCAAGERAEAGAEDPEDREGNNGPLKRIDPADVMDGLRRLAGSGVLGESWREILADAMTLLWLRYER